MTLFLILERQILSLTKACRNKHMQLVGGQAAILKFNVCTSPTSNIYRGIYFLEILVVQEHKDVQNAHQIFKIITKRSSNNRKTEETRTN